MGEVRARRPNVADRLGSGPEAAFADWLAWLPSLAIGAGLVALAAAVYWLPGSERFYNHFVWQAVAFLHGRAAIDWPVASSPGSPGNAFFQDVYPVTGSNGEPNGTGLLPFPPLPALVLVPFVALWGLATDERAVSVVLGAVNVGLCWWALGKLEVSRSIRLATTLFFAFGTVFWYAAQLGTTWFFAHVVAISFVLLAIGVALGADPEADDLADPPPSRRVLAIVGAALRHPLGLLDGRQVLAGFLFGIACTARVTIAFGAPFFVFVGGGGSWARRSISAAIGAAVPIGALLLYNLASTGHLFTPVYDYLYQIEATGYPGLHYHADWAIEDVRYLPQNLAVMFLSTPAFFPDQVTSAGIPGRLLCTAAGAARSLFDPDCPIAIPRDVGMGLLFTSPGYLLALPALTDRWSRLVAGSSLAVLLIGLVNVMHFSQGWVQFGYRFSNDFVVFALPLVAVGLARRGRVGWLGAAIVGVSIAINLWGVAWGNILGW